MSPFCLYIRHLRKRYKVSQGELAKRMGYEQGYISGLELGKKGPPNKEFEKKLIQALKLNVDEQEVLSQAIKESQRIYKIPSEAPIEIFRLVNLFWHELRRLHPAQVKMISETLRLREKLDTPSHFDVGWDLENPLMEEAEM